MSGPVDWDGLVLGPTENIFGETATYTPAAAGSAAIAITGVFDRAWREADPFGEGSESNLIVPVFGVRVNQFPAPPTPNDQVFIPSVNMLFLVRDVRPDGHGWAKLMLMDIT